MTITIIGAGLAGTEAAWQASKAGVAVELVEMRPAVMTRAHRTGNFAELVCSNSFRGAALTNAVGLLKEELKVLDSLFMEAALHSQVPAGGALAVDRNAFSHYIEEKLNSSPLITIRREEVKTVPASSAGSPVIVAAGPLCSAQLTQEIKTLTGQGHLAFFDAISPIILGETIDYSLCFRQSRYDKGAGEDYLNIPLSKEDYENFVGQILSAEKHEAHPEEEGDEKLRPFEGCMPIEDMAARGKDTLLFGPLKPVGLTDPRTGKRPYAVIQLRQEDRHGSLWNMVGMQTRMKHGEQLKVFRALPPLARAEFARLGTVHRNTFINSPACLKPTLEFRDRDGLIFCGQITGTEGYVEAAAGGWLAGTNAARLAKGLQPIVLPRNTALGSLVAYISDPARKDFQPMNISFGLIESYNLMAPEGKKQRKQSKQERRLKTSEEALAEIAKYKMF